MYRCVSNFQHEVQMLLFKTLLKNKWVYVIILALLAITSGGVYSDQIIEMIQSLLAD